MNLRVAWIRKAGAALVGTVGCCHVAAHRIGGEVEDIAVPTGRKDNRVGDMACDFSGQEVPRDNALGVPVYEDQVHHLVAGVHVDLARFDLTRQGSVGP